jgi:hypothetical protein
LAAPRIAPPRLLLLTAAVLIVAGLAACGSSSDPGSTTTSAAAQQPGARRGVFSGPKVQACLKKAGVQVPQSRRGSGQPPGGGLRNSPEFQKLRDALLKCGVTLPNGPRRQQQTTTPGTTNS